MASGHLTELETGRLYSFLADGQINRGMLPVGMSIGMDSMGPMRDTKTDKLFPGIVEAMGRFSTTLDNYQLMFVVATNGPDVEGEDILNALDGSVASFAVTQGGGKLISRQPQTGELEHTILADEKELMRLRDLEAVVTERPLMRALLGDREPIDGDSPIRTPYADMIRRLGIDDGVKVETKEQNRRNYVMPRHNHIGDDLSKYSGADIGSKHMSFTPGYHERIYEIGNSLYVADKAVDITGEGQRVIGVSERSMIIGSMTYFGPESPNPKDINVINIKSIPFDAFGVRTLYFADLVCRLAVNITMNDSPPRMDRVENVPVLHIGSGLKALEAITYLYQRLHG